MAKFFRATGAPYATGDIWSGTNNAAKLFQTEFFGLPNLSGEVKYNVLDENFNSVWRKKPFKYFDGTDWVTKPVKYWDGTHWIRSNPYNQQYFPKDLFSWTGTASNNATLSRAIGIGSPTGGYPLFMQCTGTDPHTSTYNADKWNIAPTDNGDTWRVKVWARTTYFLPISVSLFIFGADYNGAFINNFGNSYTTQAYNIGSQWSELTAYFTFNDPTVRYIQVRLDGPDTGNPSIFWNDLRVVKVE